ncbi:hypothetical protein GLE_1572 [Lysobacter enzymogenes]|uniref:Uncharacterized protein n=1 Tax=Lysobacter enzymogenes TaxID=69 RepID=A0A0S2DEI2_LYSEN|nr:hypothetical protein GLE_1572 [Lysobacter enzymogenes]
MRRPLSWHELPAVVGGASVPTLLCPIAVPLQAFGDLSEQHRG